MKVGGGGRQHPQSGINEQAERAAKVRAGGLLAALQKRLHVSVSSVWD